MIGLTDVINCKTEWLVINKGVGTASTAFGENPVHVLYRFLYHLFSLYHIYCLLSNISVIYAKKPTFLRLSM